LACGGPARTGDLRKRFQLVKEKLVVMARREELMPSGDGGDGDEG